MKRLIVLAALATLLGSASGCSMLNRSGAQSCETCDPTSPAPLLSRLRLPSISLPWRRAQDFDGDGGECNTCNEGFTETGFSEGQVIQGSSYEGSPVVDGQIIGGPIYEGPVEGFIGSTTSGQQTLYHPEVVGPVNTTPSYSTKYAGELIPAPGSPVVDLGK